MSSGGASSGGFSRSALASILSGGAAPEGSTASGPIIEGNLQILNAIEAGAHGEQVLSVTHNENGTVLSKLIRFMFSVAKLVIHTLSYSDYKQSAKYFRVFKT